MNLHVMEINVGVELRDKSSGVSQVLSVESVSLYLKLKSKQAMARNFFSFLYSGFCKKRIGASAYLFIRSFLEQKGTSRQRSGKGAIRQKSPLKKPRWEIN